VRIRAYSNVGGTWVGDLQIALPVLAGLVDVSSGIAWFVLIYLLRIVAGYLDYEKIHATDYLNWFQGTKAAARVKVLK